jgi:hypothetical protein
LDFENAKSKSKIYARMLRVIIVVETLLSSCPLRGPIASYPDIYLAILVESRTMAIREPSIEPQKSSSRKPPRRDQRKEEAVNPINKGEKVNEQIEEGDHGRRVYSSNVNNTKLYSC